MKRKHVVICKMCLAKFTANAEMKVERLFVDHLVERHSYEDLLDCASSKVQTPRFTEETIHGTHGNG